jgi:tripartite-type tricarboxylate transporter receptor subunit TctC
MRLAASVYTPAHTLLAVCVRPLLTVLPLLLTAGGALAQEAYPNRPIRIVVPTAPGGPSDVGARLIGAELTKRWGKQVVVDIRPGAGTIIGTDLVVKAPADGYTLLMSPSTLAINPATYKKLPYDVLRDLAPITQTHYVPNLIAAHPSMPAKTIRELIVFAKARPNEIMFASSGHGTNPHLVMELLAHMGQIKLMHIPYKGTLPGLIETIAGRTALIATSSMQLVLPNARAGKLRVLAITSATRVASLPEIPAVAESGLAGYEAVQWTAMMAPAATPADILTRLQKEIVAILRMQDLREKLAVDGAEIVAGTPEELTAFMRAETVKWAAVVKAAGIPQE